MRVEYALTEMAWDLTPALEELAAWTHRWLPAPGGGAGERAHAAAPTARR